MIIGSIVVPIVLHIKRIKTENNKIVYDINIKFQKEVIPHYVDTENYYKKHNLTLLESVKIDVNNGIIIKPQKIKSHTEEFLKRIMFLFNEMDMYASGILCLAKDNEKKAFLMQGKAYCDIINNFKCIYDLYMLTNKQDYSNLSKLYDIWNERLSESKDKKHVNTFLRYIKRKNNKKHKNMRNILIILFLLPVLACYAQENENVEKILEEKYGYACYHSLGGGYYSVRKDGKEGACDLKGREIIPPTTYDEVSGHQIIEYGYCEVKKNGKTGVISKEIKEVIPCQYDGIRTFQLEKSSNCEVKIGNKWGVYNIKEAKEVIPCLYEEIYSWELDDNSCCNVKRDGKWGICNNVGKEIVPCKYVYRLSIGDDLFLFNIGGTVDSNNNIIGGKWGYLDMDGKEIIPAQYDNASVFRDGVAQVTKNGVVSLLQHPKKGTTLQLVNGENSNTIDTNIPETGLRNEELFIFAFANENYTNFSGADYSINDGKTFCEYGKKTLGVPEKNIHFYEDATFGNMQKALSLIKDIADVYDGDAKIIFYFSGLGLIDDKTKDQYLLPSDATLSSLSSTGLSIRTVTEILGHLNIKYSLLLLDAPFNGNDKKGKLLSSARGVQIASKNIEPTGNLIVCTAGMNDDNVYSDESLSHGVFTYCFLEQLRNIKDEFSLKELIDLTADNVKKKSLDSFKTVQKPQIIISEQFLDKYQQKIKL